MRTFCTQLLCLFTFIIVLVQCDKPPIIPRKNVYVTGIEFHHYFTDSVYAIAKLWVNGVATDLNKKPDFAEAKSVAVSGTDVYVAGSTYSRTKPSRATLWKNTVPTYLGGPNSQAFSVSILGKDVYVSGTDYINGVSTGVVWKNGVASYLINGNSYYGKVFAQNKDFYTTGYTLRNGIWESAVFKNQQPLFASLAPQTSEFTSVYFSGSNVYATGDLTATSGYGACVWTNGIPHQLGKANSTVNSVFANNNNVFVTGRSSLYQASLWKNNVSISLQKSYASEGFSVFAINQDVYVAGIGEIGGLKSLGEPVLWKNGIKSILPTNGEGGFATSVCAD